MTERTIRFGITSARGKLRRARPPVRFHTNANERAHPLAAWIALIGLILPSTMNVFIGEANFMPGRICVILLFLPAIFTLCQRGRRAQLSDLFAFATTAWMIAAAVHTGGWGSLSSAAGAESLEFIGAYLIARGFFFEPAALNTFLRVLKVLAVTSILLAMADTISGRWMAQDIAAAIFNAPSPGQLYRNNIVRATSTFDHPILFGVFCSLVAAICIYSELNTLRRILLVGLCFVGCLLSLSSAALMSFSIALAVYMYDRLMKQYSWRWSVLCTGVATFFLAIFLLANNPLGWLLTNLTMDPDSAHFRLMIWDAALVIIHQFPLTGFGFKSFDHVILDTTIDSVWLVSALRYGVPMIVILILTNVAAFWPTRQSSTKLAGDYRATNLSQAFTIVLVMFMFTGLTVHFWNIMWIFWGLCIGIRASLRERSISVPR